MKGPYPEFQTRARAGATGCLCRLGRYEITARAAAAILWPADSATQSCAATMLLMQPCSSAARARRRQRARPGCARHRCTVLAAILLSGCGSALDATPRRTAVARLAAAAVAAGSAPALADPRWPPDDAFGRPAPPRGFTASVSDAAVGAARKQKESSARPP